MDIAENNRRIEFTLSMLPKNLKGNLLDVGCYKGKMIEYLSNNIKYFGIDIEGDNKEYIIKQDLNLGKLPFESDFFDYVVCTDVLEHLFFPKEICKEIQRVLKADGIGIISLPNDFGLNGWISKIFYKPKTLEEQIYWHHWIFSIELSRKFVSNYFDIIAERPYFGNIANKFIHQRFLVFFPSLCSCWFMKVIQKRHCTY